MAADDKVVLGLTDGSVVVVDNPSDMPDANEISAVEEPWMQISVVTPTRHIGAVMDMVTTRRGTYVRTDYLDETELVDVTFIDGRPSKTQISLRLEPETITKLKELAKRKGVGYQTLIRMWVMERLAQESG